MAYGSLYTGCHPRVCIVLFYAPKVHKGTKRENEYLVKIRLNPTGNVVNLFRNGA